MSEKKIAVIGDKDVVLAFKAVGVDVYPSSDREESKETLIKLARNYLVILITEDIASQIGDIIDRYKTKPYPLVLPIPSAKGASGFGEENIRRNIEKAVGSDILFGAEISKKLWAVIYCSVRRRNKCRKKAELSKFPVR